MARVRCVVAFVSARSRWVTPVDGSGESLDRLSGERRDQLPALPMTLVPVGHSADRWLIVLNIPLLGA